MRAAVTERLRVLHATPGRVRIHIHGGGEEACRAAEETLRRVPGVKDARANPLTGNVLVHFDPGSTGPDALLGLLDTLGPGAEWLADRGDGRPARVALKSGIPSAAAALGLGLLGARRRAGRRTAAAAGGVSLLQNFPLVRAALRHLLGRNAADLLFLAADLLTTLLTTAPFGLAFAGVEVLLLAVVVLGRSPQAAARPAPLAFSAN